MPKREVQIATYEKMDMIRHDDVATDADSHKFALLSKMSQRVLHRAVREKPTSAVRVERDKPEWRIIGLKYSFQSRRSIRHEAINRDLAIFVSSTEPADQAFDTNASTTDAKDNLVVTNCFAANA